MNTLLDNTVGLVVETVESFLVDGTPSPKHFIVLLSSVAVCALVAWACYRSLVDDRSYSRTRRNRDRNRLRPHSTSQTRCLHAIKVPEEGITVRCDMRAHNGAHDCRTPKGTLVLWQSGSSGDVVLPPYGKESATSQQATPAVPCPHSFKLNGGKVARCERDADDTVTHECNTVEGTLIVWRSESPFDRVLTSQAV